ncbi:MAG: Cof-type HAD-IIB family hydrolase [Lachnospiraceae bacterium]|nr:Cof-type HAD-IIB family hydrolase [Lachnospiraceae bacterium]
MIKLIVSDMDGTLFNSNQEISPHNLAAIREASKQGVRFMIATGRSVDTIGPTIEKYDLHCGLILLNGAEVRDENSRIINTINIDYEIIPEIARILNRQGYIPEYMTNKGSQLCGTEEMMEKNMGWRMMCLDRSHTLTLEEAIEQGRNSVFQKTLTRNNTIEDMLAKDLEIRKIIVFNPDREFNTRNREELMEKFPELSILSSYPENIEINSKYAQKGHGLQKAIEKIGISKDEVAVFGDGLNDLSMFELFPNAYAPANAEFEIREKAKEIIPSNNDDGVGKKIFELLYKNKEEA